MASNAGHWSDVGDVDGDRDEVGPVRAGGRQAVVEVLENLSCLGVERLVCQRSAVLVDRQLAGQVGEVPVDCDVGVVATRAAISPGLL